MWRMMIATALVAAVVGIVLAHFWTMQRRFMYFPTASLPAPALAYVRDALKAKSNEFTDIEGFSEFVFGAVKNPPLLGRKILAGPIDVEVEHRHR